ncbi:MAG: endonuclease domain-containing protein [Nevskiales bacterium]
MQLRYGSARDLRERSTDVKRLLWSRLRNRQLSGCKFRRQQPIGSYIVDFVCLERRLVIGLDGGQHLEQQAPDEARTAFLQKEGYCVLRFWNNQILSELDAVLEMIYRTLADSAYPSPNPLPQGERASER